ncbi:Prefoldin subunit domain-containing protein [Geopyxis carbonaria]|nr:Prefoldin subunit domain-containing protein [Geopyxis carbonaria]
MAEIAVGNQPPTGGPSTAPTVAGETNPRGIPLAPFVSDVESFCPSRSQIEPNLKKFQEMIAKYQFMEMNTTRRAAGLKDKIPDITKTLETVRFLEVRNKPVETTFELNDTLYAKATIGEGGVDEVYLWLGANVMLAYPVAEARELLEGKLSAAKESLKNAEEDLDFLRAQITTLEVNTARLYNYEVTLKRKEREEEEAANEKEKKK